MNTADSRESRGPVMMDVAKLADVSQKTVSRVINDAPNVRPEVRQRVRDAIRELGYRPNLAARALVTQRTHVIGVVAVGAPQFGPTMRVFTLEHAARALGYELAVGSPADTSPAQVRTTIEGLLERGVEGIVLEVPTTLTLDPDLLAGVPITSNVGWIDGIERQAVIGVAQVEIGRTATDFLLDLGHRSVAHIAGPDGWEVARQRQLGWSQAHAERGLKPPRARVGDWSARSGYEVGVQLLADEPDLTAVFASNDQMAIGFMRAAAEAGKTIPTDISIVGMDDIPEAEFQMVPLTTFQTDHAGISEETLKELVALIEGRSPGGPATFPSHLIIRKSSGPPPPREEPQAPRLSTRRTADR